MAAPPGLAPDASARLNQQGENDEAPGRHQGQSSSSNSSNHNGTPIRPHLLEWHTAPIRIFEVVAGSGRSRFLMLVRCPHCPDIHAMSARELRPLIRRKAPCALGVVVIHTHADEVAA